MGKDVFAADFRDVKELKIPVYFFQGRHDWNVPSVLVEAFAQNLKSPKEIVWFENSGHSPLEEEPKQFNKMMVEKVLHK